MHASDFRKIDLVCGDDESRPELQCVYLHEGHLYAADGYIGARLLAHPTCQDTDGLIPKQAIAMARGADSTITANETVRVSARGCTFDRPEAKIWAEHAEKFDRLILGRAGMRPETHEPIIAFDARRLWQLAKGVCEEGMYGYGVGLYLGDRPSAPILVSTLNDPTTKAALMPMQRPSDSKIKPSNKLDIWHALDQLKAAIDNNKRTVKLTGDLLDELRKVLCVEVEE